MTFPDTPGLAVATPTHSLAPLAHDGDVSAYHRGLMAYRAQAWDDDRWKTFRLRFGVYAENRPGRHMIRLKLPGGRLSFDQARALARLVDHACDRPLHLTTRQDIQIYGLDLDATGEVIEALNDAGLTTREASGNTLRNVTSCPLAGICPKEQVDAGAVADQLARTWIRHPLTQHMPRKFKTTVSGCAADCGYATVDDLGLIAVDKDGEKGFQVFVGGGLGSQPRLGILVAAFVRETDLPAIQETLVRLHQTYSKRGNRNRSRIKFLVDRFGAEGFTALFQETWAEIRDLPRRPWQPLDWREPDATDLPVMPGARIDQHDGKTGVVIRPDLGRLTPAQVITLANEAERGGAAAFRLTRDQNLVVSGLAPSGVDAFVAAARATGLTIRETPSGVSNIVSCPGTETCPIGITNSSAFSTDLLGDKDLAAFPELRIRISGCHNSCGQHFLGDIGLHGYAKKVQGRHVPHYRFHIGGKPRLPSQLPMTVAGIPAVNARVALKALHGAYTGGRRHGENIRDWAERQGKPAIIDLLTPFSAITDFAAPGVYHDFGKTEVFAPPATMAGECAAPAVVAEYLADLAEAGRQDVKRALAIGDIDQALAFADRAHRAAQNRLLSVVHRPVRGDDGGKTEAAFIDEFGANRVVAAASAAYHAVRRGEQVNFSSLDAALAHWIETANRQVELIAADAVVLEQTA